MSEELPIGKIIGLENWRYHAADAVTSTRLRVFADRPSLYHAMYIAKTVPPCSSPALDFGGAFHALVEGEPEFRQQCIVNTKFDSWRTDASKEWRAEQEANHLIVVQPSDLAVMLEMRKGIDRNPTAKALLEDTEREVSWRARIGKFVVQCRCDRWCDRSKMVGGINTGRYWIELKTCEQIDDDAIRRSITNFRYDIQSAYYGQVIQTVDGGSEPPTCFHIFSEKNPPYSAKVYVIDDDTNKLARASAFYALKRLKRAYDTGDFSDGDAGINPIGLTFYGLKEAERELEGARLQLEA